MINLTSEQKEILQNRIKAAKKWGFSHAFLWLNENDKNAKIEIWAMFDLNGHHLLTFRRVKMEEFKSGGCPVGVNK